MEKIIISKAETDAARDADAQIVIPHSEVAGPVSPTPGTGGRQSRLAGFGFIGFWIASALLLISMWLLLIDRRAPSATIPPPVTPATPGAAAATNQPSASTAEPEPEQPRAGSATPTQDNGQPASLKKLFDTHKHRVFIIQDKRHQGSGALLLEDPNGRLLVTARHVVEDQSGVGAKRVSTDVLVTGFGQTAVRGSVVGWHLTQDLALVWLPGRSGSAAFHQPFIESARIGIAEPVWTIGHPMGQTFSISDGKTTRLPAAGLLQFNAPISSGNSGGPLYDMAGNLLAVVSGASDGNQGEVAQNLNFAICADALLTTAGWHLESIGAAKLAQYSRRRRRRPRRISVERPEPQTQPAWSLCQLST